MFDFHVERDSFSFDNSTVSKKLESEIQRNVLVSGMTGFCNRVIANQILGIYNFSFIYQRCFEYSCIGCIKLKRSFSLFADLMELQVV